MIVGVCLKAYARLSQRQTLACWILFLLTLTVRIALLPSYLPWGMGVPKPIIHDEFSYLLAADTYVHGRLANPTHPFWQHFESFQEMQQPTYASKYQVLPGLTLAFGQKFFGEPWVGVLLTSSLLSAAMCWMLQGWIAPGWALLGGFLFALRIGVFSYWMNSYEGGSVAAIGGALALGAMTRIWKQRAYHHAFTWALGVSILMHSRPYDAAVLAASSGAVLGWLLLKSDVPAKVVGMRIALPALGVLAISLGAVACVDYRVTGSALTLPYVAHDRQYEVASPILFAPLAPEPAYRHAVMRHFYTTQDPDLRRSSREEPLTRFLGKVASLSDFFVGFWPVSIPLLLLPFALKTTEERVTVVLSAVCLASVAILIIAFPHYAAAFAGVLVLRFLQVLSRLSDWRKPIGPVLAAGIVAVLVLSGRDSLSAALAARAADFGAARDAMNRRLSEMPGKQLVLVRYAPGHNDQNEWVFNGANIDDQKVIWAREMTANEDRPFLEYFRGRHVWLLEPDRSPPKLVLYTETEALIGTARLGANERGSSTSTQSR